MKKNLKLIIGILVIIFIITIFGIIFITYKNIDNETSDNSRSFEELEIKSQNPSNGYVVAIDEHLAMRDTYGIFKPIENNRFVKVLDLDEDYIQGSFVAWRDDKVYILGMYSSTEYDYIKGEKEKISIYRKAPAGFITIIGQDENDLYYEYDSNGEDCYGKFNFDTKTSKEIKEEEVPDKFQK